MRGGGGGGGLRGGAVLLVLLGMVVGCIVTGVVMSRSSSSPACSSCAPCEADEARSALVRAKGHLLEAQADLRRCLASHSPAAAARLRAGGEGSGEEEEGRKKRRATALARLGGRGVVPRPDESVDVVLVWVNGSDAAWQFARLAEGDTVERGWRGDDGALLHAVRSLAKYGAALRIGTIHIVSEFSQRPSWLRSVEGGPGQARVNMVSLEGLSPDKNTLLWQVAALPGLSQHFLLWADETVLLGRPADRSLFWATSEGWGPRLFFDANVALSRSTLERLESWFGPSSFSSQKRRGVSARPLAVARAVLELVTEDAGGPSEAVHLEMMPLYAHWVAEHGLAGSLDGQDDMGQMERGQTMGEAVKVTHAHTLVRLPHTGNNKRGEGSGESVRLRELMQERWSSKTVYETK